MLILISSCGNKTIFSETRWLLLYKLKVWCENRHREWCLYRWHECDMRDTQIYRVRTFNRTNRICKRNGNYSEFIATRAKLCFNFGTDEVVTFLSFLNGWSRRLDIITWDFIYCLVFFIVIFIQKSFLFVFAIELCENCLTIFMSMMFFIVCPLTIWFDVYCYAVWIIFGWECSKNPSICNKQCLFHKMWSWLVFFYAL